MGSKGTDQKMGPRIQYDSASRLDWLQTAGTSGNCDITNFHFGAENGVRPIVKMKEAYMNKYQKKNRVSFAEALICVFVSTCFAVSLQFFKGDILDSAVAGDVTKAAKYFILLVVFILCEVMFYFSYKQFSAKFVVGCTKHLKQDIFESILSKSYVEYKEYQQGEFIAKYINEADTIKTRRFSMLPLFWEIIFKIVFVSIALFFLDWRIALITIILLTTPLYIPKLIEKRLQKAQTEHIKAVENSLAKINDWLSGFETIKNFSIEHRIMSKFEDVNNASMEKLLYDTQLGAVAQLITTLISYFRTVFSNCRSSIWTPCFPSSSLCTRNLVAPPRTNANSSDHSYSWLPARNNLSQVNMAWIPAIRKVDG